MNDANGDRKVGDLIFRPGKTGFVFYDDRGPFSGHRDEVARTWAFSTIEEATKWLHDQFALHEEEGKQATPASSYADYVRRTLRDSNDDEGSFEKRLLGRLYTFENDMKVELYAGDIRTALRAATATGRTRAKLKAGGTPCPSLDPENASPVPAARGADAPIIVTDEADAYPH